MEALILLGVLGAGYLINEDKEKKQKVSDEIQPPLFQGSGNTIYDMNNFKDAQRYEIDQVMKHHEQAMKPGTKVIDSLNMDGRNTLKSQEIYTDEIKTLDGGTMKREDFLVNDQGIKVEPFFSGSGPASIDLGSRSHRMDAHFGGYHADQKGVGKRTDLQAPLGDQWVPYGNVYGNTFDGARADQSRYNEGMYRTNELPFEQERVQHIDVKSDVNRDVDLLYAQRNSTDNRRTLNNQKISFGGKVLAGKGIDKRGEEGQVFKHLPDQDYVNSADKWLVTTGAVEAPRIRPEQELKETNRQYLNEGDVGPAAPVIFKSNEDRPNFKKSTRQQLLNDTERNIALEGKMNDNDHNKSSYFVYPNEREITSERTYEGNFKSVFNAQTEQLQDNVKPTVKETTLDSRDGFVGPTVAVLPEERLQDNVRPTVKSTTMFEYSGNGGTTVPAEMASDQFLRADLNPNKEVISRGRDPTPESTKLANGMDTLNVDIKKIESDYFNPRINNPDKVYQEIPQDYVCEYTQDKDTLDNVKLSDRLDPNLLDPFRDNPYTKSLASFA